MPDKIIRERRTKWANALRSGKYKQITRRLKRDDGYCCLGVACEVYPSKAHDSWRGDVGLGQAMTEFLGLSGTQISRLVSFNDDHGFSFDRIADIIDKMD